MTQPTGRDPWPDGSVTRWVTTIDQAGKVHDRRGRDVRGNPDEIRTPQFSQVGDELTRWWIQGCGVETKVWSRVSHSQLVDDARKRHALQLLQSASSIQEIAERLGYTDATNFTRALRRWTGQSPRLVRRKASR